MRWGLLPIALLLTLTLPASTAGNQRFRLAPGDYRVLDLQVTQTPLRVDAAFEVTEGEAAVRMELVPMHAFRALQKGQAHQALAFTPAGPTGSFRYSIEDPGTYRLVVSNRAGSATAVLSLDVRTSLNPDVTATELPVGRRAAVIVVSFLLFFAMVGYSGWKLRKAVLG